ncbi:MAG: cyclic nucleotide-binding domain-containing protein [Alphaproteobacteria bacterium]|nr:cyclic nucleotide-binding domain-containing protein [Alphaproteobacteria bacterium]
MQKLQYKCDDILYEEGARSEGVCRIISGHAEVSKRHGNQMVVVGRVGPGELVGEMSAIEGRRRGATVRATSDLVVEVIDREDLLRRVSQDKWLAFHLLVRLSDRLTTLDRAVAELKERAMAEAAQSDQTPPLDAPIRSVPESTRIHILPRFKPMNGAMPRSGLQIEHLPFTVGRRSKDAESPFSMDLLLDDSRPYRLSRAHFAIMQRRDAFVVHDLDSALGTEVNGQFVGRHFATDFAPLNPGQNNVTAGGANSPFVFRVELQHD